MLTKQVTPTCFIVTLDTLNYINQEYMVGHIKRYDNENPNSDLFYWMFYPLNSNTLPLSVGDLREISKFIANLNREL